jgi:hypothetical protein
MPDDSEKETNWSQIGNFVVKVGVPSAIALYLVYIMTSGLSAKVDHIQAAMANHTAQAAEMINQYEQVRIQSDRQLYVMQRICINAAKTPEAADACLAR